MKLLYIGKSNKNFTHNRLYSYSGFNYIIDIKSNRGLMRININEEHNKYFFENFKILNDKEEKNFLRKQKLKKINKN